MACKQRRGVVFVNAPDGTAVAGIGDVPTAEAGELPHLSGSEPTRSGRHATAYTCRFYIAVPENVCECSRTVCADRTTDHSRPRYASR